MIVSIENDDLVLYFNDFQYSKIVDITCGIQLVHVFHQYVTEKLHQTIAMLIPDTAMAYPHIRTSIPNTDQFVEISVDFLNFHTKCCSSYPFSKPLSFNLSSFAENLTDLSHEYTYYLSSSFLKQHGNQVHLFPHKDDREVCFYFKAVNAAKISYFPLQESARININDNPVYWHGNLLESLEDLRYCNLIW